MQRLVLLPTILATLFAIASTAQRAQHRLPGQESTEPEVKVSTEEILKQDQKESLKDAAELVRLAEEIKTDLEKNDRHVLSVATLKKTEEIEKVARRLRGRLKKF
jgi:hypothetical protein